jgi:TolB protein
MMRPALAAALVLPLIPCACAPADETTQPAATSGAQGSGSAATSAPVASPIAGAEPADHLIEPDERHFAHLWQVTRGGENAEGYWSFAGDRLSLQRRAGEVECDRIFVTDPRVGPLVQVSSGRGVCTCSYFLPGDREVIFASTQATMEGCPPPPDRSQGYTWTLYPEHELWVRDLESGEERRMTDEPGYDAEATVSPRGDRIVFTSVRSGDPELWTCALDGSDLVQVTDEEGYDGGAFFSHDGRWIVFRSTMFAPDGQRGDRAGYRELLARHQIRPMALELMLVRPDGSERRQLTRLGHANFAPSFFPDDARVIFSSNHHDPTTRERAGNFDLFAIGADGEGLERITTYAGFDSFPMFSPDGRFLAFASNRGGTAEGETNLFVAQWRD